MTKSVKKTGNVPKDCNDHVIAHIGNPKAAKDTVGKIYQGAIPADDLEAENVDAGGPVEFLPLATHEVPTFPVHLLPPPLKEYVEALAEETQTPTCMGASLILSVLSAVCAKKFSVNVKPGWAESTNLWTFLVAESGTRKSAIFKKIVKVVSARRSASSYVHVCTAPLDA